MAEKMTLTAYLAQRGVKAKALTRGEAELLGIPYPLQCGWPRKYGAMIIAAEILPKLTAHADVARQAAEEREHARKMMQATPALSAVQLQLEDEPDRARTSSISGFVLRRARRFRKHAPWA